MPNKLYRSRTQRMIAGVCGGIGEYLKVDPTLIRLILVALVFVGFSGVLAYLIAWVIIPEEPEHLQKRNNPIGHSRNQIIDSTEPAKTEGEVSGAEVPDYKGNERDNDTGSGNDTGNDTENV